MKFNYNLQWMRAYAAVLVVGDHSILRYVKMTSNNEFLKGLAGGMGAIGVFLFFILSGFLMVKIADGKFGSIDSAVRFAIDRLRRIAPLYWLVTTAYVIVAFSMHDGNYATGDIIKSLFFIATDARPSEQGLLPVVGVGWSLNYEMLFYAIFALCLILPRSRGLALLVIAIGGLVALGRITGQTDAKTLLGFYTREIMLLFLCGAALAVANPKQRSPYRYSQMILILAVMSVLVSLAFFLKDDHPFWRTPSLYVLSLAVFAYAARAAEFPRSKLALLLGNASYSIYLTHGLVLDGITRIMSRILPQELYFLNIPICILGGVVVGVLIYTVIEAPLNARLRVNRNLPKIQQA